MTSHSTLRLIARQYPTVPAVLEELSRLRAKLTLPRPITHVISDVHGEHSKLRHVINNASGGMRVLVDSVFADSLDEHSKQELLAFLYYPVEKMQLSRDKLTDRSWRLELVKKVLRQQFQLVRALARLHTHEALEMLIPANHNSLFLALLDELAYLRDHTYVDSMLEALADHDQDIRTVHMASRLVRNLSISEIVVAGDLPDRGERVDKVIHFLKAQPKVTFAWGNHDVIWLGATLGSEVLIATVLRLSLKHLRLWQLEEGYGILLSPLSELASKVYANDPAPRFCPSRNADFSDEQLLARMHKAIAVIEFKLSGQMIARHPEWNMDDRRLLDHIDYEKGTITLRGVTHLLTDTQFPTVNPADPHALSPEERICVERLKESFTASQRLWDHMLFVVQRGAMSLQRDHALIFHACLPVDSSGHLLKTEIQGESLSGAALFKKLETIIRSTYRQGASQVGEELDYYYWLWANGESPLLGKERMTTFERYFIADKSTHIEPKNPYYEFIHDADFCRTIGREFGMEDDVIIVNGHVPVKIEKGEDPVKRGGNAVSIDGAFSEDYGDYGYTLMLRPDCIELAEHSHFESVGHFLERDDDMQPKLRKIVCYQKELTIADTRASIALNDQIEVLEALHSAYRNGTISEAF